VGGVDPNAALASQTQLQLAGIQAGVQQSQIDAAHDVASANVLAQLQAQLASYASSDYQAALAQKVSEQGITAQENVQLAGIASQVQLADISSEVNKAQIGANVDMAAIAAHTYAQMMQEQTTQVLASYQTQENLATVNAAQNISLAQIAGTTAIETEKVRSAA